MTKADDLQRQIDDLKAKLAERENEKRPGRDQELAAIRKEIADLREEVKNIPALSPEEAAQIFQVQRDEEGKFPCPKCQYPLDEDETPCPKCGEVIAWEE